MDYLICGLIFADSLRERNVDSYNGKKYDVVDWENTPSDMESNESLFNRSSEVFKKVYAKHHKDTVMFVAHHAVNSALIRFLRGLDPKDNSEVDQNNTNKAIA